MKRIVVLNSGGFDSSFMIKLLKEDYKAELHSLYFSYGQLNDGPASVVAQRIASKYCDSHTTIQLPEIKWTKSGFYNNGYTDVANKYLEARNLIFASYAISYAQSINADSVAMALIKDGIEMYPDTSIKFAKKLDKVSREFGVMFKTPLIDKCKESLFETGAIFGMTEDDFFSCDVPVDNKPCGLCPDCKATQLFKGIKCNIKIK